MLLCVKEYDADLMRRDTLEANAFRPHVTLLEAKQFNISAATVSSYPHTLQPSCSAAVFGLHDSHNVREVAEPDSIFSSKLSVFNSF